MFPTPVMAEQVKTYPIPDAFVNVPIPKENPMNAYSIPKQYANMPVNKIYSKKLGKEKFEKLVELVKQQETKNQHLKKDGTIQIGPAGELGIMQIKPTSDLGTGVAGTLKGIVAQVLKNKDENERIGRLHLMNLLGHTDYDIPSTIIAWNRGLPTYRDWDNAGRKFEELPTITQKYLKAVDKYFPKRGTFVEKKQEEVHTPVVEETSTSFLSKEPKISLEDAKKKAIPDYQYIRDRIPSTKREVYDQLIETIMTPYLNDFDNKETIGEVRNEVLKLLLDNYDAFRNTRTDTGEQVFPVEKMEGGFVSA